jgi:hypothetical protein
MKIEASIQVIRRYRYTLACEGRVLKEQQFETEAEAREALEEQLGDVIHGFVRALVVKEE